MTIRLLLCASVVMLPIVGCGRSTPEGARDLPPGDPERGRQAFVDLQCHTCHEVAGAGLPPPSVVPPVSLGGRTLLPPSQDELAEDIMLPSSHFAAGYPRDQITANEKSRMPDYSKALNKQQLADLTAFLKQSYQRGLPSPTR